MNKVCFSKILQMFFLDRLLNQKNSSPQTICSYRDTFKLLLNFICSKKKKQPSLLTFLDFNASVIVDFLEHLEIERNNSINSRNSRLSAIRSFFKYASFMVPEYNENIQTILAIPLKRSDRNIAEYLSKEEVEAIINAPDLSTWSGMRDHVMFMTLYNTGARVSEILAIKIKDVTFSKSSYIKLKGKGRKERTIPLWKRTTYLIRKWINHLDSDQESPLFPNAQRKPITRFGIDYRLRLAKKKAEKKCPSLAKKEIHAHVFRHTTAMHLLQSGIDINLIALWLGHENPSTTHQYLQADLEMKEKILCLLKPPSVKCIRFQPSDSLLKFLSNL